MSPHKKNDGPVTTTHPFTIGCDWDEEGCWWAVVTDYGNVVDTDQVASTPDGLSDLLDVIRRHVDPDSGELPVLALESTRRPLFRALQDAGVEVVGISANNLWGTRAGRKKSKSDKNDAIKIARHYRSDTSDYHPLPRRTEMGTALALLARQEKDAAINAQRDAARVRSILAEFYPGPLGCWSVSDLKGRLSGARVLLAAPTPAQGRALTLEEITAIIKATGKKSACNSEAAKAYGAMSRTFVQYPPEVEEHFARTLTVALQTLEHSVIAWTSLKAELQPLVKTHPYWNLIKPAVGAEWRVIARLIGEMSDDPNRFPTLDELAAFAGTSPLDNSSHSRQDMKRRDVKGNRLHRALWDWAEVSRKNSPGAKALYWNRRKAGDGHATAIRKVAFKITVRLHYCLQNNIVWDEAMAWPHAPSKADAEALRVEVKALIAKKRKPRGSRPTPAAKRADTDAA